MARPFVPIARLGWQQQDGEFVFAPWAGPNRMAADGLVAHLRSMGHLEVVDDAQACLFVMLAEAVDGDPTNASLWGQYRAAELQLRGVTDRDKESAFDTLLKDLAAGATALPDTTIIKPANKRAAGRKGVGGDVAAIDAAPAIDRRRRRGTSA